MSRGLAEQETIFRWDRDEKVLWANTAHPGTAEKWAAKGHKVAVIGYADGEPSSWSVRQPFTRRGDWIRLFSAAVPSFMSHEQANGSQGDAPRVSGDE